MKKFKLAFYFSLFFMGYSGCSLGQSHRVCFQNRCVEVQTATTEEQLKEGLKHRSFLPEHEGMLFIFQKNGRYDFWMQDTLIPLDILWLDENRNVIDIASKVPPCITNPCPTYGPSQPSRYVLEVNAGVAERLKIKIGDHADYKDGH